MGHHGDHEEREDLDELEGFEEGEGEDDEDDEDDEEEGDEEAASAPAAPSRSAEDEAQVWLEGLFERLGMKVRVKARETDEVLEVSVTGADAEVLLADMSATGPAALQALQTILQTTLYSSAHPSRRKKGVVIDAANYRQRRFEQLQAVSAFLSEKVRQTGGPITILGMNSFDRRAIHTGLRDDAHTRTESEGVGPFRRLKVGLGQSRRR